MLENAGVQIFLALDAILEEGPKHTQKNRLTWNNHNLWFLIIEPYKRFHRRWTFKSATSGYDQRFDVDCKQIS